jgi:hypothetical protein
VKLAWFILIWPVWATATIVVALLYPPARLWLILPLGLTIVAVAWRMGMLFERYVRPRVVAHLERPWVPLHAVINDVARAIENAQESPLTRWFWMGRHGEPEFNWTKLAEVAVDAAARSSVKRRRDAAVRRMMGG